MSLLTVSLKSSGGAGTVAAAEPNNTRSADDEREQGLHHVLEFASAHPCLTSQTSDEEKQVKGACLHLICRK